MPEGLQFCKISGRLRAFGDTDSDGMPVFVGAEGDGTITCNATVLRNNTPGMLETYFSYPIHFNIDADGYISFRGLPYVMVLAPSPVLNPPDFNYRIKFRLDNGKRYGPFHFNVVPGGEVDVATLLLVTANAGVPIAQGPAGPPGPAGPAGPPGIAADSGMEYSALVPLSTWIIPVPAGFSRRPSVTVYDETGEQVEADITVSAGIVSIHFSSPFAGTAVLN